MLITPQFETRLYNMLHVSHVSGETLFPDESSELGKQVRQLCKRLDMVEMDIITYGIIYHPHLSEAGCQISGAEQRSMRGQYTSYQLKSCLFFT